MKKILIMLLTFIALNSNVNAGIIDSTLNTITSSVSDAKTFVDTSGNFKLMYNDIKDGISALASNLKVGTEQVLRIIVKKYILLGIYKWLIIIGLLITSIFLYRKSMSNLHVMESTGNPLPIFGIAGTIGCLVMIFLNLDEALFYTFNPEYYVLEEIVNIVKSFK